MKLSSVGPEGLAEELLHRSRALGILGCGSLCLWKGMAHWPGPEIGSRECPAFSGASSRRGPPWVGCLGGSP
jgi:hypothetical protein